jgi:hypothetical protein
MNGKIAGIEEKGYSADSENNSKMLWHALGIVVSIHDD